MKHKKCDICGFEAGNFTQDMFSGKLVCIECLKRINLVKQQEKNPGGKGRRRGKNEPEVDTVGDCVPNPAGRSYTSVKDGLKQQLKFDYYE